MPATPKTLQPTAVVLPAAMALALAGLFVAAAANLQHLAWWCLPLCVVAIGWRLSVARHLRRLPGRAARLILVALLTLTVIVNLRTLSGLAVWATLLVAMCTAKLLEARTPRDWYLLCGAALYLLLAACLDREQLWRLPIYVAGLWLVIGALHGLGSGGGSPPALELLRRAGRSLLLALPLALVLFVCFPRLPGAFWALPTTEQAVTGLGDEMSPGSISSLFESDEPAFRARFDGAVPPPEQRYWRGPVLHDFDGYTWRRRTGGFNGAPELQYVGPAYRYQITLEPNEHNTIIALEMPASPELPFAYFTGDEQLIATRSGGAERNYTLTSYPLTRNLAPLSALARQIDLTLPANRNPRTVALAQALRRDAVSDRDYIAAVVRYLRAGGFQYTLTPPRTSLNSVDDFLFDTREGFCGHFASAFATLMRAGGVPARVVTGYQGGEWNRYGQYLGVRQSQAHAWTEVWLEPSGWVRIDPTAIVAPQRLTSGVFDLLGSAFSSTERVLHEWPWIGNVIAGWQALSAWWQDDVVGFGFLRQMNLLERLGFNSADWRALPALLAAGGTVWMLWMLWILRHEWRSAAPDRLARAWLRVGAKLAAIGLGRRADEGPLAYAERCAAQRPMLAEPLRALARQYAELRYGPPPAAAAVRSFARAVRAFRIA
jgi:protein-glutamine gamma-glutamyltransferase